MVLLILSACEGGPSAAPSAGGGLSVGGVPVICGENIEVGECSSRADGALRHSLPSGHPPVVRVVVTCNADLCDADEGSGQVIVHYNDGTRGVIDIGFGTTL